MRAQNVVPVGKPDLVRARMGARARKAVLRRVLTRLVFASSPYWTPMPDLVAFRGKAKLVPVKTGVQAHRFATNAVPGLKRAYVTTLFCEMVAWDAWRDSPLLACVRMAAEAHKPA